MFNPFERKIAFRYLRARKGERFVSVIAIFSLVGIALGVATLIIVMSVMNGFRQELLGRILGLNGHMAIYAAATPTIPDYAELVGRVRAVPGVVSATPLVEGQVLMTSETGGASGGLARGVRPEDMQARRIIANNIRAGSLAGFMGDDAVMIGTRLATRLGVSVGQKLTLISPQGRHHRARHRAPPARLHRGGAVRGGHERIRQHLRLPADGGGADLLPDRRHGEPDRGLRR